MIELLIILILALMTITFMCVVGFYILVGVIALVKGIYILIRDGVAAARKK